MDLRRVPNEEKVRLSRVYMYGGLAFLPFLWFVNVVWFFKEAFLKPQFQGQQLIRKHVIFSFIGFIVWVIGLTTWICIFQSKRADWGELGDRLSFLIPLGEP